jgi:hypothetical protein
LVTFCCINDLEEVSEALKNLSKDYPKLYEKLEEMVYLTRALHFKFQYLGALLMDEPTAEFTPISVHESVLRLYKRELQNLKDNPDFPVLVQIFTKYEHASFNNICLLVKGMNPQSLVGPTY